ncbi:hypothetical protein GF345_02990 [Candidatus Woesearchaeota archaeon]|nr:hypothetical protein [Candidatus Woesearchaeota archaeon]
MIPRPAEYLAEWMLRFLKNKDLIFRRIDDIDHDREKNTLAVSMKDGTSQFYLIEPFIDDSSLDSLLDKMKDQEACSLVIYNTKENLDVVTKNWDRLARFRRDFSISFINPFSRTEKRWVVYPATHSLVTDESKIKQSLKVLFSNVEPTNQKDIEKIIKSN